jgi:REP element-mobilizing transposase RayT
VGLSAHIGMGKFKGKYRIESARLPHWDYRWEGIFFITICTDNRKPYFGEINNGKMRLSPVGVIADILWYEIYDHSGNVDLDAFVVMPNHIHGILIIHHDDANPVETLHATSLRTPRTPQPPKRPAHGIHDTKNKFMASISPKPESVSSIIRSYKSAVTRHAHRLGYDFAWQPRFYDRIVRNRESYNAIKNYIINNPANGKGDRMNPEN